MKEIIACRADRKDPCAIGVRMPKENGTHLLTVYDNGIGMPAWLDTLKAKSPDSCP